MLGQAKGTFFKINLFKVDLPKKIKIGLPKTGFFGTRLFKVLMALALVAVLASTALVALASSGGCATPTITWVGNTSSSWHTASNWDANRVPGTGDHVCIQDVTNTNAITFSTGSTSVASLESAEALTVSGGTLELTSTAEGSKVNKFTLSGGTLGGAGSLTIPAGGNATWSGGYMTGTGRTVISGASGSDPAATLAISGASDKALYAGRTLENAGSTTFTANYISSGTGATIENSGSFEIKGDGDVFYNFGGSKTRFENTGALKKSSGTASTDISASVDNDGSVEVASGTLNLNGGTDDANTSDASTGDSAVASGTTLSFAGNHRLSGAGSSVTGAGSVVFPNGTTSVGVDSYSASGTTSITGANVTFGQPITTDTLNVTGGSATFNAATTPKNLTLSGGTLGGSGTVSVPAGGSATWSGGDMAGTGRTVISGASGVDLAATLAISSPSDKNLRSGRVLENAGDATFTANYVSSGTGAVIENSGSFEIKGDGDVFYNHGGTRTRFENTGALKKSSGTASTDISASVDNDGSVEVASGTLNLNGGTDDANTSDTSTGDFAVASGTTLLLNGNHRLSGVGSSISGAGSVVFPGGTTSVGVDSYLASGTTTASGANVTFATPLTVETLNVTGGTASFNAATTAKNLTFSGGALGGSGNVTVLAGGSATWSGGDMTGSGRTVVSGASDSDPAATLVISGSSGKQLYGGRTLENAGDVAFTSTAPISSGTGAVIENLGTFDIRTDADILYNFGGTRTRLENTGTLKKSSGTGSTDIVASLDNDGAVEVTSGTLYLNGGTNDVQPSDTSTGNFVAASGTALRFGGDHRLSGTGSSVTGAGTIDFPNGTTSIGVDNYSASGTTSITGAIATFGTPIITDTLNVSGGAANFNSQVSTRTLNLSGGTLGGSGTVNVPAGGTATWSGGDMIGSGRTVVLGASGSALAATLTISGSSGKSLHAGRVLDNAGDATFTSTAPISSGTGAVIENSGTFDIRTDADILYNFGGTRTRLENTGTLKKSSGTASSDIGAAVGNDGGIVEITSGTLYLNGGLDNFSSTGGVGTLAGGTYLIKSNSILKFTGADIDVNAADIVLDGTGSAIVDQNNADAIDNLYDNDGSLAVGSDRDLKTVGALTNDGSVSIGAGSVLTTTGSYAQGAGGTLGVEIGGTSPGIDHAQLDVGTTASMGGTLDIDTLDGFTPTDGQSFKILKCGAANCRSAEFDTVRGANLGPDLEYQLRYNAQDVTLEFNPNVTPVANDQTVETDEDTAKPITLSATDADSGDTLTYKITTLPQNGTLYKGNSTAEENKIDSTGTTLTGTEVTYVPNQDYNNTSNPDTFKFSANDGTIDSNEATVSINVAAVNDAPSIDLDGDATNGTGYEATFTEDGEPEPIVDSTLTLTDVDSDTLASATVKITNLKDGDAESLTADTSGATATITASYDPLTGELELNGEAPTADYQQVLRTVTYENTSQNPNTTGRSVTFIVSDGTDDSETATSTITVEAVNDAPTVELSGEGSANEGDTKTYTYTVIDPDSPAPAVTEYCGTNGTPTDTEATNSFDCTFPDGPASSTVSATATDSDNESGSNSVDVAVANVAPSVTAPTASQTASEGTSSSFDPGSFADPGKDDPWSVSIDWGDGSTEPPFEATSPGSLGQKSHTYADDGSYTVTITVTEAGEGTQLSDYETFTVTVGNVTPTANAPTVEVAEDDQAETITLSGSDAPGSDSLSYRITSLTTHGTLYKGESTAEENKITNASAETPYELGSGDKVTYVPDADYNGSDGFDFEANDGDGGADTATVAITVTEVNDEPEGADDTKSTPENTPLVFPASDLLANDSEGPDNEKSAQTLTVDSVSNPVHGTVELTGGQITFTPERDYNGKEASFDYTVCDDGKTDGVTDRKCSTLTAKVNITVSPVNSRPTASDGIETMNEDGNPITIDLAPLVSDKETSDANLTYTVVSGPTDKQGELTGTGSTRTFEPADNYNGLVEIVYAVTDRGDPDNCGTMSSSCAAAETSEEKTVTITVAPGNDAPVADAKTLTTEEDTPGSVTLTASDPDGDTLTYEVVANPTHGTLSGTGPNLTYTPDSNYAGTDTFTYKASDGSASSNVATVAITVTAANDAPTADDDSYNTDEDVTLNVTAPGVLDGDTDAEGDTLSASVLSGPTHGDLDLNGNGSFTYTPTNGYHGADSFEYTVSDGKGGTDIAKVTITVNQGSPDNEAPTAKDDTYAVTKDGTLTRGAPGVLANDSDLENDSLTAKKVSDPSHGSLQLDSDGSFTYKPEAGYTGTDSFTYKANDGFADSSTATVDIAVGIAPTVRSVTPTSGQTGVARDTSPTATFSGEMDPKTISASTVKLQQWNKKKKKWQSVPIGVKCDDPCKFVTLDPYPNTDPPKLLAANAKYRVTVTTGAEDTAGNALDQDPTKAGNQPKVWTFTTGSS